MSLLDRTQNHSPDFDQSLQAVLGVVRLLSQLAAQRPDVDATEPRVEPCAPSPSSSYDDPASLAVLGVIAVACELRPMIDALRTGPLLRLNAGERAEQPGEIERITSEDGGRARRTPVGRAGLLR